MMMYTGPERKRGKDEREVGRRQQSFSAASELHVNALQMPCKCSGFQANREPRSAFLSGAGDYHLWI